MLLNKSTYKRKRTETLPLKKKKNKTAKDKQWWTSQEDERLRSAVDSCGAKNWKLISEMANVGKSDVQCLQRWTQVLRPGLKKGTWSKEEDKMLTELVTLVRTESKHIPWKKIEKEMGGRTAKQCRERWKLSLDPCINKAMWSKAEDDQLMSLQSTLGNSWSKIKDLLGTNRTENAVKLRYKCLKKRADKFKRNISHRQSQERQLQENLWGSFFIPFEPKKEIKEEKNALFDHDFELFDVKENVVLGELDIGRFDSVKTAEFDEVLQILSEDDLF